MRKFPPEVTEQHESSRLVNKFVKMNVVENRSKRITRSKAVFFETNLRIKIEEKPEEKPEEFEMKQPKDSELQKEQRTLIHFIYNGPQECVQMAGDC